MQHRNFYDQPVNDLIKQYDEITTISTGQGDDYTTACLLDFAYFFKKCRSIAANLSKQNTLDADSRAIQQIIFTGTANAGVMIYYILEQSKETILKFASGNIKSVVTTYRWLNIVNVKLSDTQLKKLKTAVENKTGTTLRMSLKVVNGKDLPHELLLTTRQKTKLRNAFNNNMSTDLKLSKAQISKIIYSLEGF